MSLRILNILGQRPEATGSGIFLREIMRAGAAAGDQLHLLCAAYGDDDFEAVFGSAVETIVCSRDGMPGEVPHAIPGMSDAMPYHALRYSQMSAGQVSDYCRCFSERIELIMREFKPDIVHVHHLWALSSLAARFTDLPWVATLHGTELKQLVSAPQHRHLAEKGARHCRHFFSVSRDIATDAVSEFSLAAESLTVIGNGFNPSIFFPEKPVGETDIPIVLCAGKFVDWKGFAYAIQASARVRHPHRLAILGTGPSSEHERLLSVAEAAGVAVAFPGHIDQEEVADWMRRASIFLLPSIHEPFGLVLLEAMACGCPPIAAASGGPRDLIGSEIQAAGLGTLIPALGGNPHEAKETYVSDIADALDARLNNPLSMEQRKDLAARVRGMTWERVYAQQREVYSALLKAGEK